MEPISNTALAATIDNTAVELGQLAVALVRTDLGDEFDKQICRVSLAAISLLNEMGKLRNMVPA